MADKMTRAIGLGCLKNVLRQVPLDTSRFGIGTYRDESAYKFSFVVSPLNHWLTERDMEMGRRRAIGLVRGWPT